MSSQPLEKSSAFEDLPFEILIAELGKTTCERFWKSETNGFYSVIPDV